MISEQSLLAYLFIIIKNGIHCYAIKNITNNISKIYNIQNTPIMKYIIYSFIKNIYPCIYNTIGCKNIWINICEYLDI